MSQDHELATIERVTQQPFEEPLDLTVEDEWSSDKTEDGHCHLDRANTHHDRYFEHEGGLSHFENAPLWAKQDAVGVIHRGRAFGDESLNERMSRVIWQKVKAREKQLWAITDCSPDIGDRSFQMARKLKRQFGNRIDMRVGAYPIFGFKTLDSDRRALIEDLASDADFLVGLPERDARPDHAEVGFDRHMTILIELAVKHQIPLQMHLDQTGLPGESGTERFVEAVNWLVTSRLPASKRPPLWAVHVLSPSSYDEERFIRLAKGLKENDIGVIVCPHAAISMRAMRNVTAPIHNLIARVMELALVGVRVRIGTDNIRDLFMPRPASPLLVRELDAFASAVRFYDENVIHKLVRGEPMNNSDLVAIAKSLDDNYKAYGWDMSSDRFRA